MQPVVDISKQTHVRAVFADNVAFFDLPPQMTLEDLSERIARLGEHHVGGLISIDVRKGGKADWVRWAFRPSTEHQGRTWPR
jgi:hypothetical protein